MSRHLLTALPEFEGCEVAVGWDAVDGTFFGYVLDARAGEGKDPWLVNIGALPGEIRDPYDVIDAVQPYAVIPEELVDELAAEASSSPGPVAPRLWTLDGGDGEGPVMPAASPGVTASEGPERR